MPNILVQIGEALGTAGSLVLLLLIVGGSVWVVMSVQRNRADHDRLESKVDELRKETREQFKEIRGEIKQTREQIKEISSRLDRIIECLPPLQ